MKRKLAAFAVVLAAAGAARAQEPAPAPTDLASLLPPETLLLVSGTDLGERFRKETALGRLWAEPEVRRFFEGLMESVHAAILRQGIAGPLAVVGLEPRDLFSMQVRGGGFAVVDFDMADRRPDVDAVLFLEFADAAGAEKLATGLRGGVETFLGPWEKVQIGAHTVHRKAVPPAEVLIWSEAGRLVLTTKGARMERMLAGLQAPPPDSLRASARYGTAIARMGAERTALVAYADVKRLYGRGMALARREGRAKDLDKFEEVWRKLGLDALEAVAFADIPSGDGWRTELCVTMDGRRGLFSLYPEGKPTHRFARHVPKGCLLYGAEQVDLVALWDAVLELVGSLDPRARADMEEGERFANAALGVDLRRDVGGALGKEWAAYLATPPGGGLIPDFAVFVEVKDRARLEAALETILKRLQGIAAEEGVRMSLGEAAFRGHRIRFLEMAERGGDPIPVAPAWVLGEDHLVLALYPQTVKHALMEKAALPAHDEYRDLLRRVPETAMSATYVDAGGMIGWLYNSAVPLLQVLQGGMHVHAAPLGLRLNMQDLFTADVLARHLGGCMTYTAVEKDCVRMGYVSDFGVTGLLAPAALLGAAGGIAYMGVRDVHAAEAGREEKAARAAAERARAAALQAENDMLRRRLAEIERQLAELRRMLEDDGGGGD